MKDVNYRVNLFPPARNFGALWRRMQAKRLLVIGGMLVALMLVMLSQACTQDSAQADLDDPQATAAADQAKPVVGHEDDIIDEAELEQVPILELEAGEEDVSSPEFSEIEKRVQREIEEEAKGPSESEKLEQEYADLKRAEAAEQAAAARAEEQEMKRIKTERMDEIREEERLRRELEEDLEDEPLPEITKDQMYWRGLE